MYYLASTYLIGMMTMIFILSSIGMDGVMYQLKLKSIWQARLRVFMIVLFSPVLIPLVFLDGIRWLFDSHD